MFINFSQKVESYLIRMWQPGRVSLLNTEYAVMAYRNQEALLQGYDGTENWIPCSAIRLNVATLQNMVEQIEIWACILH